MIPNRFHFVFGLKRQTRPLHLIHYLCLASCLDVNRPEAVYFYYHHEPHGRYWDLIRDHIIPIQIPAVSFIDRYRYADARVARYKYAHASDFVRLEKLVAHGGIYADMDTLFVNPIPRALRERSFVIGREDDIYDPHAQASKPSLCNAFLMAERNAPFGKLWLDQIHGAFDGTWSNHSTLLPNRLATQHPNLVHIESSRTFYKHMWTRTGLHTLLEGLDTDTTDVVSFHLWSHLWWSRWRRDFSTFYADKITEAHVRQVDTTYNVVARKHLPPPETRTFFQIQAAQLERRLEPVRAAAHEAGMRAYIAAKIAMFSVIKNNVVPRSAEHLDYARRQWKHPEVRTRFRARNRHEQQSIFDDVALWDSYGIEKTRFQLDDVILDIGAHAGIFSYLCHARGAGRVLAFEPEMSNFRQLALHLRGLKGVELYHFAVFRSDQTTANLVHSGHLGDNSGGGNVMLNGAHMDPFTQTYQPLPATPRAVPTIPLDEIIERVGCIRLLKLDCEGSEFPILLTSRRLDRVERIVGEYHHFAPPLFAELDPQARLDGYTRYDIRDLVQYLKAQQFHVTLKPLGENMGLFSAARVPSDNADAHRQQNPF